MFNFELFDFMFTFVPIVILVIFVVTIISMFVCLALRMYI